MAEIIRLKALDGTLVEFEDEVRASGGMKDVYFSPSRTYAVAFFRDPVDASTRDRLETIVGPYREKILSQEGGEYLQRLYRWPTALVEHRGRVGLVVPFYERSFFFEHGSKDGDKLGIKGKEKDGKWFCTASMRSRFLDPREWGDHRTHLQASLLVCRALRRLHAAGLAHSDLSYKNVLIDPVSGRACVIDIDGLVVPGKFPPEVVGTPDFIAPEVVATAHLDRHDPDRRLPSRHTDLHALATLVYMYLFHRHPLRGDKIHDPDPQRDEELSMGSKALWIEDPDDRSNAVDPLRLVSAERPWKDTTRIPHTIAGPHLAPLFQRAFGAGLSDPQARPSANEWELALVQTMDLLQPCANPQCSEKWFVFDNTTAPACPFCQRPFSGSLPVLNFYTGTPEGNFRPENRRLMVYSGQSLFPWHADAAVVPNERLREDQKRRVGYFVLHEGTWYLVNESLPELYDAKARTTVGPGGRIALEDGAQILLSRSAGGRLVSVQLVQA